MLSRGEDCTHPAHAPSLFCSCYSGPPERCVWITQRGLSKGWLLPQVVFPRAAPVQLSHSAGCGSPCWLHVAHHHGTPGSWAGTCSSAWQEIRLLRAAGSEARHKDGRSSGFPPLFLGCSLLWSPLLRLRNHRSQLSVLMFFFSTACCLLLARISWCCHGLVSLGKVTKS